MKFIDISRLNEIYEDFKKSDNNENFQEFIENCKDKEKIVCIDTEPVSEFLEQSHDEDYDYLLECEKEDLKWFGKDYLTRLNFFRALLGAKEVLAIEEIKEERKDMRVKFRLIELKADGDNFEFIIEDVIRKQILCWEAIKYLYEKIEQYLMEHLFPEDKLYLRQEFLDDIKDNSGYMRLRVKSRETADFICKMLYELTEV